MSSAGQGERVQLLKSEQSNGASCHCQHLTPCAQCNEHVYFRRARSHAHPSTNQRASDATWTRRRAFRLEYIQLATRARDPSCKLRTAPLSGHSHTRSNCKGVLHHSSGATRCSVSLRAQRIMRGSCSMQVTPARATQCCSQSHAHHHFREHTCSLSKTGLRRCEAAGQACFG